MAEGRATISFEAENTQLKAKAAETEAALKKVGASGKDAGGGLDSVASSGKQALGLFAGLFGTVGLLIGALPRLKALAQALVDTFGDGAVKVAAFTSSMDAIDQSKAAANLVKVRERLSELAQATAQDSLRNLWNHGRTTESLKQEEEALKKLEVVYSKMTEANKRRADSEAQIKKMSEETAAIEARRAEADLAMAQVAGDEAAAREVHLQAIRKLEAEAAAARSLDELIATTELIAAKEELYRKAREKRAADEAKQREADLKAEQEKARKEAQAQIDAARRVRDELERLRREQEGSVFGSLGGVDYYGRGGRTSTFFGGGR